jgi:hypothetical protein
LSFGAASAAPTVLENIMPVTATVAIDRRNIIGFFMLSFLVLLQYGSVSDGKRNLKYQKQTVLYVT